MMLHTITEHTSRAVRLACNPRSPRRFHADHLLMLLPRPDVNLVTLLHYSKTQRIAYNCNQNNAEWLRRCIVPGDVDGLYMQNLRPGIYCGGGDVPLARGAQHPSASYNKITNNSCRSTRAQQGKRQGGIAKMPAKACRCWDV